MKVLFVHPLPFALAHGGFQTQIEQTKAALEQRGVEVEYVRWWDDRQTGDLIHHFTAPPPAYLEMAREKGIPSVVTHLFTSTCNRPALQLKIQGAVTRLLLKLPRGIGTQSHWKSFLQADKMIVGLEAERRVLQTVFGLPPRRIAIVPLGLHRDFLEAGKGSRSEPHLITTGTITDRKRSIELARMARQAEVPVLFVGKPYNANDAYGKEFAGLVDNRFVLHHDHVSDRTEMIRLLKSSRGFVICSRFENWCLSAHEAAACGLPLLVPDQPWSRECFGPEATYLEPSGSAGNAARLRAFYEKCPDLPAPAIKFHSWDDVAKILEDCYRSLLKTSR
jgi:glycosyltransferase involved in cell wall biosynthesis